MERRSVSFPPEIWKLIKDIAAARPHHTENAIIIDLIEDGLYYRQEAGPIKHESVKAPKKPRK